MLFRSGPHEGSAIGNGCYCRYQLQRRHGNALSDCRRCNIRITHIIGVEEDALLLARQVDAGLFAEPEEARIVHEFFRTERESDLCKTCKKEIQEEEQAVQAAEEAVKQLETMQTLEDLQLAKTAVEKVKDAAIKARFQSRIHAIAVLINPEAAQTGE